MRSVFAIATAALFGVAAVSGQTVCQSINTFKTGAAVSAQTSTSQFTAMSQFIVDVAVNGSTTDGKAGLFHLPALAGYFNSAINYRNPKVPNPSPYSTNSPNAPDYTAAGDSQTTLVTKLTQFFGAALGCDKFTSSQAYVAPTGGNQYTIHRNMNITNTVFSAFVGEIAGSAARYNISASTIGVVAGVLNGFKRTNVDSSASANAICADSTCTCATGYTTSGSSCVAPGSNNNQGGDASTASFSFAAIVALAAAALAIKQ